MPIKNYSNRSNVTLTEKHATMFGLLDQLLLLRVIIDEPGDAQPSLGQLDPVRCKLRFQILVSDLQIGRNRIEAAKITNDR
jgi:hypothetical protein